jgi:hypothetical protein
MSKEHNCADFGFMPGSPDCPCGGTGRMPAEEVEADPEQSADFLAYSQIVEEQEYQEEVVNGN